VHNEVPLEGGWGSNATRSGEVVLRRGGPQSGAVMAWLHHLHTQGIDFVPAPVDGGFAPDGREQLRFIEGEPMHPRPWSDDAVWTIGRMLREIHDGSSTFTLPRGAQWRPSSLRSLPDGRQVVGHCDLGPWNILARNGEPVAFIDWDDAGPVGHIWDLVNVVWLNVQLHDDDVAELNGLPPLHHRARQGRLLLDGYGLASRDRIGLVARMIEWAVRTAREEAIVCGVTPDSRSPADNGFPTLWALTWRVRAAAWMFDHRRELEVALEP
jgi:hypothetical protein